MIISRRIFISITVISLVLLDANVSYGQQWSGILTPSRAINWSNAGVIGGIPATRTQCVTSACSTVTSAGAGATAAQIQAAWASAPANTYVPLAAGTYSFCLTLSG